MTFLWTFHCLVH